MADNCIEPRPVIQMVSEYVYQQLRDARTYSNRSLLDQSGVWSLHQLARDIYALGVKDGTQQEADRAWRQRERDNDMARAQHAIESEGS